MNSVILTLMLRDKNKKVAGFIDGELKINCYYNNTIEDVLEKLNTYRMSKINNVYNVHGTEISKKIKLNQNIKLYIE